MPARPRFTRLLPLPHPQDHFGRAEGYNIVHADEQFFVPTDGKPLRGLIQARGPHSARPSPARWLAGCTAGVFARPCGILLLLTRTHRQAPPPQDHIVAGTLMTMKDTFLTQAEYSKLIYECVAQDCRWGFQQGRWRGGGVRPHLTCQPHLQPSPPPTHALSITACSTFPPRRPGSPSPPPSARIRDPPTPPHRTPFPFPTRLQRLLGDLDGGADDPQAAEAVDRQAGGTGQPAAVGAGHGALSPAAPWPPPPPTLQHELETHPTPPHRTPGGLREQPAPCEVVACFPGA